jgi:hypothetical protein
MWYRVAIDVPDAGRKPALFFAEVDGDARVWVNGREVGASEKKRTPFSVDVSGAVKAGRNTVAVRVDHTNITDLYLGGILRPVLLVDRALPDARTIPPKNCANHRCSDPPLPTPSRHPAPVCGIPPLAVPIHSPPRSGPTRLRAVSM